MKLRKLLRRKRSRKVGFLKYASYSDGCNILKRKRKKGRHYLSRVH